MPGFHWPELLVLVFIALLIFGPKRLPEMGSSIGRTIREFQKSFHEIGDSAKSANTSSTLPSATAHPADVAQIPGPSVATTTTGESGASPAQSAKAAISEPGE